MIMEIRIITKFSTFPHTCNNSAFRPPFSHSNQLQLFVSRSGNVFKKSFSIRTKETVSYNGSQL